jgi:hypothetical protein
MKKSALAILIIISVSISLGAGIFLYYKKQIRYKNSNTTKNDISDFTRNAQLPSAPNNSLNQTSVSATTTAAVAAATAAKIDQNYLKSVQKAADNFNNVVKINADIGRLLLKAQQSLQESKTDELVDLASQIKNRNSGLSSAIVAFQGALDEWKALNVKLTDSGAKTGAADLINLGYEFSRSALQYSDIIGKILEGDSLIIWQLNLVRYNKEFQENAVKMADAQKNFADSFNNFKNLISS